MTTITAKAIVNDLNETEDGSQVNVHMGADYGTDAAPINQEWAAWTPGLSLVMGIKPELAEKFPIGGKFTLTFELDDPEAALVPATPADPTPEIPTTATNSTQETPTPTAPDAGSASAEPADPASSDAAAESADYVDPTAIAPTTVDHNPASEDQPAVAATAEPIAPATVDHNPTAPAAEPTPYPAPGSAQ